MTSFDKTNVIVSGSRSAMGEYANYTTVIPKPTLFDGHMVLTQSMISKPNTKYVIKWNFELGGDVTIPENCILEFDGGSISGEHTITGANTGIQAGLVKIFGTDVTLAGTWNVAEAYPEWFGAKGDGTTNDVNAINSACLFFAHANKGGYVILSPVTYRVDNKIVVNEAVKLKGSYTRSNNRKSTRIIPTNTTEDAAVQLGGGSIIEGIEFYYNGHTPENIIAYPPTILVAGNNAIIRDITFLNSYDGIYIGTQESTLIENVHGFVLNKGLEIGNSLDITRISNVHFNYNYLITSEIAQSQNTENYIKYAYEHGIGFLIIKADWVKIDNCFCYGYNIGFQLGNGSQAFGNADITKCGADACWRCVFVNSYTMVNIIGCTFTCFNPFSFSSLSPSFAIAIGALSKNVNITNCFFYAFVKDAINFVSLTDATLIERKGGIEENNTIANCTFVGRDIFDTNCWVIRVTKNRTASIRNCTFLDKSNKLAGILATDNGRLSVLGCLFSMSRAIVYQVIETQGETKVPVVFRDNIILGDTPVPNLSNYVDNDRGNIRPTEKLYPGVKYFDTTLGKPIWWNGTAWVDATGATV